jgi:hypothetical protein
MNGKMLGKAVYCIGLFHLPPLLEENEVNMIITFEHSGLR